MKIEDTKNYQLDGYFTLNEDGEELEDFAKIKLIKFCAQDIQTIIRYGIPELLARIKKEDDELGGYGISLVKNISKKQSYKANKEKKIITIIF